MTQANTCLSLSADIWGQFGHRTCWISACDHKPEMKQHPLPSLSGHLLQNYDNCRPITSLIPRLFTTQAEYKAGHPLYSKLSILTLEGNLVTLVNSSLTTWTCLLFSASTNQSTRITFWATVRLQGTHVKSFVMYNTAKWSDEHILFVCQPL